MTETEAQIDPGPQFVYYEQLGHEISREIPIYLDPEEKLEAFSNIFRMPSGLEVVMFHIRMFAPMNARMYRDFLKAIPSIEDQFRATGHPVYTFFYQDTDTQGKFALKHGWKLLGEVDMYDRRRRIYMYDKHLLKDE